MSNDGGGVLRDGGCSVGREGAALAREAVREAVHAYHLVVQDLLQQTRLLVDVVDRLADERERCESGASDPVVALTPRELHVLELLARGSTNRRIARDLRISERTVKNHLHSVYAKLEVADRTGAVVKAIKAGLVAY
jgi:DNA-binding NarL/FixJ family response regulator